MQSFHRSLLSVIMPAVILSLFIGCAAHRPPWGNSKTGFVLQYQWPADKNVSYKQASHVKQTMDIMGQSMETTIDSDIAFKALKIADMDDAAKLQITIDSTSSSMQSMQGNMSPDMEQIRGKQFSLLLSRLGKESQFEGTEALTYTMAGSDRNLSNNFQTLFPNLAARPIKIGDSWTSRDTLNINEGNTDLMLTYVNENTLVAMEAVNGRECIKVAVKSTGKMSGTGMQRGADLVFDGTIESNDEWYFAYKEGLFVKSVSEAVTTSEIKVSGPADMTIPMNIKTNMNVELVD